GAALVLLLAASLYSRGAGDATMGGIVAGIVSNLFVVGLLGLAGYGAVVFLNWLHHQKIHYGRVLQNSFYFLGLCALLGALWFVAFRLLRTKLAAGSLILGGAALLSFASLLAALRLPGASYVFAWPAVALFL